MKPFQFLSFRRNLSVALLGLIICGCSKQKQIKLQGKYNFIEKYNIPFYDKDGNELPPPPPHKILGFNFYSKDSCESNEEYFDPKSFHVDYFSVELGRKTIYKVNGDSLKIYHRTLQKWKNYQIIKVDENNLALCDGNVVEVYAKKFKQ